MSSPGSAARAMVTSRTYPSRSSSTVMSRRRARTPPHVAVGGWSPRPPLGVSSPDLRARGRAPPERRSLLRLIACPRQRSRHRHRRSRPPLRRTPPSSQRARLRQPSSRPPLRPQRASPRPPPSRQRRPSTLTSPRRPRPTGHARSDASIPGGARAPGVRPPPRHRLRRRPRPRLRPRHRPRSAAPGSPPIVSWTAGGPVAVVLASIAAVWDPAAVGRRWPSPRR